MPLEFNLTHEETVSGWDNIMAKYKEMAIDQITYLAEYNDEEAISLYLELAVEQAHKYLDKIIEMQDRGNITDYIHECLAYIIGSCVFALQNDFIVPSREAWDKQISINRDLMIGKNKVYGSAWSIMRPIGIIDIIHVKIHRIISILKGQDNKFEGCLDSFQDIINYCVFCVMRMNLDEKAGMNYETD